MDHESALPLLLVLALLGGCSCAATCLVLGGGVVFAVLCYSLGGSATLLLSALTFYVSFEFRARRGPAYPRTSSRNRAELQPYGAGIATSERRTRVSTH